MYPIEALVKTYRAEIHHPSQDLLLRMLVTITNSSGGYGSCVIPTLRLVSQTGSDLLAALGWNQIHLTQKLGFDFSQEDLLHRLGLSKQLSKPYHASILASGPMGNAFEGILIAHGTPAEITNRENRPVEGELTRFLAGLAMCYPDLVCVPGFEVSERKMFKEQWQKI